MKSILLLVALFSSTVFAGVEGSRFFVGSSAFMLVNLNRSAKEPPDFYQLNLGYRLSSKDVLSVEMIGWKYYAPLGSIFAEKDEDKFPGKVSAQGVALAYQRFLWGKFYTAIHALWMNQKYLNPGGGELGTGEQLFLTFRLGYHIALGKSFFVEPSVAMTHWPINRGLPASFQVKEDAWPNYAFEPGLHFGYVF